MVLLRWLSSWFLISKRNIQVHQKDTLDLSIHSSCLKALNDGGCLRLNQVLSREFKVKSPPWLPPPPPPSLARAWGKCFHWPMGLKRYKNFTWQTKGRHDQYTDFSHSRTNRRYNAFAVPSPPPRDWHGGPFPAHGDLAQGLSLTMRPTRTTSPVCFSHRSDQKPGYCQLSVRTFWPILRYVFKNSARYMYVCIYNFLWIILILSLWSELLQVLRWQG